MKNKRLKEAIDGVGMVNNLDSQDFDKKSVGTAPSLCGVVRFTCSGNKKDVWG